MESRAAPLAAVGGGEAPPGAELSPTQEQALEVEIARGVAQLREDGILAAPDPALAVAYQLPLRMAPGLPDGTGFLAYFFPDHDPAPGQVSDYDGGNHAYDGHRGTDYVLWPFPWNKLDAGEVQVIAAADGTIAAKSDANPSDHNCQNGSGTWNYIALIHANGQMTLYGHLRYHSVTAKGVGQTVSAGEVLGTVASSGVSAGPHLHFEVRTGSYTTAEWVDPNAGPNNPAPSLWADQPPYSDPAINRLATHSAPPSAPDPCQPAITNFEDSFTTPTTIYFYAYYRDYTGSLPTRLRISRPDGSIYKAWEYTDGDSGPTESHAWPFAFSAADPAGTWSFQAEYNGQVVETFFNLNSPPLIVVQSPQGGEQFDRSTVYALTWVDNLGGEVNISLYRGGIYLAPIAFNTPSDGSFLWTPGLSLAPGTDYTIRITSVTDPADSAAGAAPFSITAGRLRYSVFYPLALRFFR